MTQHYDPLPSRAESGGVPYDPSVIRRHANALYSSADMTVVVHVILGLALGGLVGGFVAFIARDYVALSTMFCALVGAGIGWFFGDSAAFKLRLQAQLALCQVQIELNTRTLGAPAATSSAAPVAAPVAPKAPQGPTYLIDVDGRTSGPHTVGDLVAMRARGALPDHTKVIYPWEDWSKATALSQSPKLLERMREHTALAARQSDAQTM